MEISKKILTKIVFEQYKHDKLILALEDYSQDLLEQKGDVNLIQSNCLRIALDLMKVSNLSDHHQNKIVRKYENTLLYPDSTINCYDEQSLLKLTEEFVCWMIKYLSDNELNK